jgi:hypothetical protein
LLACILTCRSGGTFTIVILGIWSRRTTALRTAEYQSDSKSTTGMPRRAGPADHRAGEEAKTLGPRASGALLKRLPTARVAGLRLVLRR